MTSFGLNYFCKDYLQIRSRPEILQVRTSIYELCRGTQLRPEQQVWKGKGTGDDLPELASSKTGARARLPTSGLVLLSTLTCSLRALQNSLVALKHQML